MFQLQYLPGTGIGVEKITGEIMETRDIVTNILIGLVLMGGPVGYLTFCILNMI